MRPLFLILVLPGSLSLLNLFKKYLQLLTYSKLGRVLTTITKYIKGIGMGTNRIHMVSFADRYGSEFIRINLSNNGRKFHIFIVITYFTRGVLPLFKNK